MTGIFAVLFKNKDRQVIERLSREVSRTSTQAIESATALQETIQGVLERKQLIDGNQLHATHKKLKSIGR